MTMTSLPLTYPASVTERSGNGAADGGAFTLVAVLRTSEFEGGGRAEQVAHQLETAIAVGLIGRGERLPPERDLAHQLGVSMAQVRQALASLRDRGVISTRRGRGGGSVVCDASVVSGAEVERRLRERSTEELRDLGDLAGSVTAASARLSAARADGPDLRRLHDLAARFEGATDAEGLRRADSRFHIGLAVAAQSQRLTTATVQVQGELAPLLWAPVGRPLPRADIARQHAGILEALAEGDELRAQALALEHSAYETEVLIDAHLEIVLRSGI